MGTFSPRDAIIPFWVWQGIYNGSNFASEIKNNTNMKTILSLILAVLATATTMAQSITGKVVDENNSPLDFVNVVLLKADSTYIAGTVTDENGVFLFNEKQDNPKFVKVSSAPASEVTLLDCRASADISRSITNV